MKECASCLRCFSDEAEACSADGATLRPSLDGPPLIDETYRLEQRLGQGGMGVLYAALHLGLKRRVALKLIRRGDGWDAEAAVRFQREAEALGRLKHPNIVDVSDFGVDGRDGGTPYLVMELLAGIPLAQHCRERGPLSVDDAIALLEPIAEAIDFAHAHGILHRDLKPANVFLSSSSAAPAVKLLDFGLARMLDGAAVVPNGREPAEPKAVSPDTPSWSEEAGTTRVLDPSAVARIDVTRPGTVLGTPYYMPPDPLNSAAGDVYSFGIMAYELLVGRVPFRGKLREVLAAHQSEAPPDPTTFRPQLPAEIASALLVPLAKDPAVRPRSARACVELLREAWLGARRRAWRRREMPRRTALAGALAVLAAALALVLPHLRAVAAADQALVDLRFRFAAPRAPDARLVVVALDEASLAADATPLPALADEMGRRLEKVFAAGARAVALDVLLPKAWSTSRQFSGLILRHPHAVTLAATADTAGNLVGPEAVEGATAVALGPERVTGLFGLVNVEAEVDGAVRRGHLDYPGASGGTPESFALRAAAMLGVRPNDRSPFWLDQRIDVRAIPRISWARLPATLAEDRAAFAGKLVLVGIDITGTGDLHTVPLRGRTVANLPGVDLQALSVATILAGLPVRDAGVVLSTLLLGAVGMLCYLAVLACPRPVGMVVAGVAAVLIVLAAAFLAFTVEQSLMRVTGPLLALGAAGLVGVALRRRLPTYPMPVAGVRR